MANAVIGALRVNLGVDTAAFNKGLGNVESRVGKFGASVAKGLAVAAAAFAAGLAGVAVGMKGVIDEADQLGKMAQSIGIPVEELSKLKHAADLSGLSLEGLATSVGRLSRNMSDVASGASAGAARAFEQLGISVTNTDGTMKSSSVIMAEIADGFAKMPDGAQKTALAMQLMGRSGATMIPMLNSGSAALNAMMLEAEQLGLVIDTKTAKAAEAFNDNLTRLGRVKDGIITQLTAHMLPAFERLSQRLVDAAKNSDLVKNVSEALTRVMDGLTRAVILVYDNLGILVRIGAVFIGMKMIGSLIGMGIAFVKFARAIQGAGFVMAAFNTLQKIGRTGLLLTAGAIALATGQFDNMTGALSDLWERIKALIPEDMTAGLTVAMQRLGLDTRALEMEMSGLVGAGDGAAASLANLDLALGSAGTTMVDKLKPAADSVSESIDRAGEAASRVGQAIQSAFSSAFDSLVEGTFNARDAVAGLLKDLAKLALNSAFQSLVGSIFGGVGIATGPPIDIRPLGFATGGGFTVGGSGGIDSQLVQFRASPGEMVDIHKSGQDGVGSQTINDNRRTFNVDARGAQRGVGEEIRVALSAYDRALPDRVQQIAQHPRRRGG